MRVLIVEDEPSLSEQLIARVERGRLCRRRRRRTASAPIFWFAPKPTTRSCSTLACRTLTA